MSDTNPIISLLFQAATAGHPVEILWDDKATDVFSDVLDNETHIHVNRRAFINACLTTQNNANAKDRKRSGDTVQVEKTNKIQKAGNVEKLPKKPRKGRFVRDEEA